MDISILKIIIAVLLFWRITIILYKPKYLQTQSSSNGRIQLSFSKVSIKTSKVFIWHIATILGLVVFFYLGNSLFFRTYLALQPERNMNSVNFSVKGKIFSKGGYYLRKSPNNTFYADNRLSLITPENELEIIEVGSDTLIANRWFKVVATRTEADSLRRDTGYVHDKMLVIYDEARWFVWGLLAQLSDGGDSALISASRKLVRWKNRPKEFMKSSLYGGIDTIMIKDISFVGIDNGRAVVNAKYTVKYDPSKYDDLRKSFGCILKIFRRKHKTENWNYDVSANIRDGNIPLGFEVDENYLIIKLENGEYAIWDSIIKEKLCLGEESEEYSEEKYSPEEPSRLKNLIPSF